MVQHQSNEIQLFVKALSYFKTHWWLFLLEALVIFGISLAKFYRTPNVYESSGKILIDSSQQELRQSILSMRNGNRRVFKQNIVQLLSSQEVMKRYRNNLTEYYNSEGRPKHLQRYFSNGNAYPTSVLKRFLRLRTNRKSDIYTVNCTAQSGVAARDLCLVYLSTITEIYPEIGQRRINTKRDFLARQIVSLSEKITDRQIAIANFEKENTRFMAHYVTIGGDTSFQSARKKILTLKAQMTENRAIKALLRSLPQPDTSEDTSLATTVGALKTRLSELRYKKYLTNNMASRNRMARLADIDREMVFVRDEIEKFKTDLKGDFTERPIAGARLRQRIVQLEFKYRIDAIKLDALQQNIVKLENQRRSFNREILIYKRLQAEIKHKKSLLLNLYKKDQETEIELSAGSAEIFRLHEPTVSGHRIAPQLSKHMFGALSMSVFAIVFTTIILIAFFPRLDNESEIHKLNLPVLGKIPILKDWFGSGSEVTPFTLEYLKIMNYRILRETKNLKCPIVIVSSPQAGEGKSTVTYFLNLASQSPNRKSLFVDGDLITNHPNEFFGIAEDKTPGIKSVLTNPGEKPNPIELVSETMHEGIYFLPRGGKIDSISSPQYLKPVGELLVTLQSQFDMIFVDTPPLFASSLAHQWAGLADLIVLVARMYLTRPKDITEALQTCKIFSKAPVGVALNCMPLYGHHQRKGHYYYFSRRRAFRNYRYYSGTTRLSA